MTTFVNRSSDIKDFPFQDYCGLNDTEMEELAERHNLRVHNSWMLPQMLAFFGSFEVSRKLGSTDRYDPKLLGKKNIGTDPWKTGIWKVATKLRRSALVKAQNNPQYAGYSALVPLVLAGLKKFQNINYAQWDRDGLEHMVDKGLYEAMTCNVPPDLTVAEILEAREIGLTVKSGTKMGTVQNPLSAWKLTGVQNTALAGLPALATTMLAQIWVAHPSLRSKYMVLDPVNWDNIPEPLITSDIAGSNTKAVKHMVVNDNPWG